jgi:hypothetical protein
MKANLSQITMILDRSGSMSSVWRPTIDGFNEFIEAQKKGAGDANVTLIQFDTENPYELVFEDRPVKEAPKLTGETFVPRGGTPLHDAIGRTIVDLGAKLAKTPEAERPGKVFVVIMTDGLENSSHEYSAPKIAEMIKHQREKYKWEFIFLGANQDAILTGEHLNIPMATAATYSATAGGTANAFRATAQNVNAVRSGTATSASYSVGQRRSLLEEDEEDKLPKPQSKK